MNNQRVIVIKHCLLADVLVLVLQRACSACCFAVPPLTLMALRFRLPVARHTTVFASSETPTVHNTDSRSLICSVKTVTIPPPTSAHEGSTQPLHQRLFNTSANPPCWVSTKPSPSSSEPIWLPNQQLSPHPSQANK